MMRDRAGEEGPDGPTAGSSGGTPGKRTASERLAGVQRRAASAPATAPAASTTAADAGGDPFGLHLLPTASGGAAVVQRQAHVGWAGAGGMNRGEATIGADGRAAAQGVRRVPLEGLTTVAAERGQGRAIVLIPPSVAAAPANATIDALVHLHGNGAARYDDHGHAPMDVRIYHLEQQLMASQRLIGILPQSNNPGSDGQFGPRGGFHPGDLVAEVFEVLRARQPPALPANVQRGQLTLSAHSGGGTELRRQMARELDASGGDAPALPGDAINHVMLFDCINSSAPRHHGDDTDGYVGPNGIFWRWTRHRLERDLAALAGRSEAERLAYLATSTRLIGTSSNDSDPADPGAYPRRCRKLQRLIDQWFDGHATAFPRGGGTGAPTVGDLWHDNYVATLRAGGEHVEVLAHRDNFARALAHLPGQGTATTATSAATTATAATATTATATATNTATTATTTTTTTTTTTDATTATATTPPAHEGHAEPTAHESPRAATRGVRDRPFAAADMDDRAGSPEEADFIREVYQAQLGGMNLRRFHPAVDPSELTTVEGVRVREVIAADLSALLAAARAALEAAQGDAAAADHAAAARTRSVGVHNGYRDMVTERVAWMDTMRGHLARTAAHRATLDDGPFGAAAHREALRFMRGAKAVPGFSNHSQGLAVDFKTTVDGHGLGPSTSQRPAWRRAWFYEWLRAHAGSFHFRPIATEEWHYDHREGGAGLPSHDH